MHQIPPGYSIVCLLSLSAQCSRRGGMVFDRDHCLKKNDGRQTAIFMSNINQISFLSVMTVGSSPKFTVTQRSSHLLSRSLSFSVSRRPRCSRSDLCLSLCALTDAGGRSLSLTSFCIRWLFSFVTCHLKLGGIECVGVTPPRLPRP